MTFSPAAMLAGLHGPNSAWTQADFDTVRLMHARSVKLLWYHRAQDVAALRALGVEHFTVRLPDSEWTNAAGKYIPSYWDYGDMVVELVHRFTLAGVHDYQLDCEPNITWPAMGKSEWDYRVWLRNVIAYMRPRIPRSARLGFPSMSFAPQYQPYRWLGVLIDTAILFEWLSVNSYWQSDRQGRTNILAGPLRWRQFGANAEWYHDWQPGMPVQIGEWGNSIQEQGVHTPAQVEAIRCEQYPLWLEWAASQSYIEAVHVYISPGATPDWQGFKVGPELARAMRWPPTAELEVLGGGRQRV